jgi:hypothetical protein
MVSALLMLRRVAAAVRYAVHEEDFLPVLAAGATLVSSGRSRARSARTGPWSMRSTSPSRR